MTVRVDLRGGAGAWSEVRPLRVGTCHLLTWCSRRTRSPGGGAFESTREGHRPPKAFQGQTRDGGRRREEGP